MMVALLFCVVSTSATTSEMSQQGMLAREQQAAISELVGTLAGEFSKKTCPGSQCRVLVADFTLPSGESCESCRLLSDAVTKQLERLGEIVDVVGRDGVRSFLEKERIPSINFAQASALEWLGKQFRATHVLVGSVEAKDAKLLMKVEFLRLEISQKDANKSGESRAVLPIGSLADGLASSEAFPAELKDVPKWAGYEVIRYNKPDSRMTAPRCDHMPPPAYTPEARKAKAGGTLRMEGVVTVLGSVENVRIVSGLPYGLNEEALKAIRTYRCKPGTVDGLPAPILIPFEDTFRLY